MRFRMEFLTADGVAVEAVNLCESAIGALEELEELYPGSTLLSMEIEEPEEGDDDLLESNLLEGFLSWVGMVMKGHSDRELEEIEERLDRMTTEKQRAALLRRVDSTAKKNADAIHDLEAMAGERPAGGSFKERLKKGLPSRTDLVTSLTGSGSGFARDREILKAGPKLKQFASKVEALRKRVQSKKLPA